MVAVSAVHGAADDAVTTVDRPYGRRPPVTRTEPQSMPESKPVGPAPVFSTAPLVPSAPAQAASKRPGQWQRWTLLLSDVTVEKAFERWARDRKATLRWLVGRDMPVDAAADAVVPDAVDFDQAATEGSADPELIAAMTKVAKAFWQSKSPFVVREYDNAILVVPRSETRP